MSTSTPYIHEGALDPAANYSAPALKFYTDMLTKFKKDPQSFFADATALFSKDHNMVRSDGINIVGIDKVLAVVGSYFSIYADTTHEVDSIITWQSGPGTYELWESGNEYYNFKPGSEAVDHKFPDPAGYANLRNVTDREGKEWELRMPVFYKNTIEEAQDGGLRFKRQVSVYNEGILMVECNRRGLKYPSAPS